MHQESIEFLNKYLDKEIIFFCNSVFVLNTDELLGSLRKNLIPTGRFRNVKKSIHDFSNFENIGKKLDYFKNKKINIKFKGFDNTFVVKKNIRNYVGTLKNNNTNIQVDFFSNLPGVQLYSAQNLNYKKKLFPYQGICLETQYFPDAPNKKNFPSTLIKPNKRYTCFTKIKIN